MKTNSMKAGFSLFRISTAENLQYRAAAFSGAVMYLFYAMIDITVFTVFYKYGSSRGTDMSLTLAQMTSFIWLKQIMLPPYGIYPEFRSKIENGDIGMELCRPWNLYTHWFAKLSAWRIGGAWWRSVILVAIALCIPYPYGLGMPVSLPYFVLFLISAVTAFLFWAAYHMLITAVRINITWGEGPCVMLLLIGDILSGIYFPLQMWPDFMQPFLIVQPFASSFDLPLRFYVGSISIEKAAGAILLQMVWMFVMVVLGRLIMRKKLKKLIVQGG